MWIMIEVVDPPGVERRGPTLDAVHDVALGQQQFGQISAVLAGRTGDKSRLSRGVVHLFPIQSTAALLCGVRNSHFRGEHTLDGRVEVAGRCSRPNSCCPGRSRRKRRRKIEKIDAAAAAQDVGDGGKDGGSLGDHRGRQTGRNHGACRSALPASHRHRRAKILALRRERRAPSADRGRAAIRRDGYNYGQPLRA